MSWLHEIDETNIKNSLPLEKILKDSLYYPASNIDGDPVKYLHREIQSFIYVDYAMTPERLHQEINNRGFEGYEVHASRFVEENELAPIGWQPASLQDSDGDLSRMNESRTATPFYKWHVFRRKNGFTEEHGPERFSLLYLCADGAAAFQALYHGNQAYPKAIAVVGPGTGFGGNWTDFRERDKILGRSVMENPHGQPELMLCCSPAEAYWPEFSIPHGNAGNRIRIWKRPEGAGSSPVA